MSFLSKIKSHRPVSRILYSGKPEPLSFIWFRRIGICAAYPPCSRRIRTVRAAQEPAFAEAPAGKQGVRGISTRKVYPPRQLPALVVRSYHTFSPLPVEALAKAVGLAPTRREVIFCDTIYAPELLRKLRRLGGAVLYVVRTFLPERRQSGLWQFHLGLQRNKLCRESSIFYRLIALILNCCAYWLKLCLGMYRML